MKKIITCLLIISLISMLFVGCKGKSVDNNGDVASTSTEEPITINFYHWWEYVDDEFIAKFEEQNPGIKVNNNYIAIDQYKNKIRLMSSTNELPDVFGVQSEELHDFAKQGIILNMQELLQEKSYDKDMTFKESIQPSLLENVVNSIGDETLSKDGQVYGVPFGAISVAVIYNKTIFDEVGIQEPTDWNQFMSNNDKLKEAGYIPLSFTGKVWGDWWYQLALYQCQTRDAIEHGDYVSGKAKWTNNTIKDAFMLVKDMWNRGHFDPGGFANGIEESNALFLQGKMAQYYVVPENFVTYLVENKPADVELGAFALPPMIDGAASVGLGGAPNIICANNASMETEKAEAIKTFVKFMISESAFKELADVNVVPSVAGYQPPANNQLMKAYADATKDGFLVGRYKSSTEFGVFLTKEWYPDLLIKDSNLDEALQVLQDKFEKLVIEN